VIDSISIKNFQSLYDVTIPLSPFTVVVGKSSSGKSAFVRAIRLLLQNARGTNFISHGEDTAEVEATFSDGMQISIERGKVNRYVLDSVGPSSAFVDAQVFTKLGGEVPDAIQDAIRIDPSLSIAGQFDPPYLLTASGGEVARTLGALTNVDVVLAAGREAARRRLQSSSTLRSLQEAVEEDHSARMLLGDVDARLEAAEKAEGALHHAEALEGRLRRAESVLGHVSSAIETYRSVQVPVVPDVGPLLEAVEDAERRWVQVEEILLKASEADRYLQDVPVVEVPEVDFDAFEEIQRHHEDAENFLRVFRLAVYEWQSAGQAVALYEGQVAEAQEEYSLALAAAGVCPTCGQETSHLHP